MSSAVTYGWGMIPVEVQIGVDALHHLALPQGRRLRRPAQERHPHRRRHRGRRHRVGAAERRRLTAVGTTLYPHRMATVHELSRTDARRIAVRAQLLTKERPTDLLETVRHLSLLQLEPTRAVAPSADIVLWSRLGSSYSPQRAARRRRRAAADRAAQHAPTGRGPRALPRRDGCLARPRRAARLGDRARGVGRASTTTAAATSSSGCAPTARCALSELPDTCVQPWRSSGWTNNQNVRRMIDLLVQRGEVAAAGGEGRDRLWDLAERVYPDDPPVPLEEALRLRAERRLSSLGLARAKAAQSPARAAATSVTSVSRPSIEGVKGEWRVDPALPRPAVRRPGRAALPARPADLRPQTDGGDLRVRLPAGDVQAGGQTALGLLGDADPVRRPAGREARRHRRP